MQIVLCNVPPADAERIARELVDRRLAACVNLLPQVVSIYRWKGSVEREPETTLLIKTSAERVAELRAAIVALHPYEVPEIVPLAVDVAQVHPPYLAWVRQETS